MTELTLTKTRLVGGIWEGVLTGESGEDAPRLIATHEATPIEGLEVDYDEAGDVWFVRLPVPTELISDGVQTFVISEADSQNRLASFSLIAGEALADDIRAEMDLLRAELDMLKRAFRRHCLETS